MKLLSLFSGIGAFEKALDRLNIKYDLVNYCEIDKYASKSYSAIHGVSEALNLGDITKVDEKALPKDIDLITYGFPCQDISLAGKQKGLFNEDGTQTRSGLFFEALRIIEETKPRVAIAENVKNLVSKRFSEQFNIVLDSLEKAGYNNYWQVMNSKDYGVPQNRERVFIISVRKDADTGMFYFPARFPLIKRLKDLLENEVPEKYYLSDKMKCYLFDISKKNKERGNGNIYSPVDISGISKTITTKEGSRVKDNFIEEPCCMQVGDLNHYQNDQMNRIYSPEGIAPAILTKTGGGRETKILVVGNYSPSGHDASRIVSADGISPTVKENHGTVTAVNAGKRVRKLTPRECFRLMDFDDADFNKAKAVNSDTQLYKQAGNSIVVACLYYILKTLIDSNILIKKEYKQMELKVNEVIIPDKITFNYDELKQELTEKVSMYESLVYTEENIKEAKVDRANLNKLKKALNDERIRREKEYMQPFADFKSKINEIISIIDKPVALIDKQVKEHEEKLKQEKMIAIEELFRQIGFQSFVTLDKIFNEKWLNASTTLKSIEEEMKQLMYRFSTDLLTLNNLPGLGFEAAEVYKTTLDINKTISEAQRMSQIAKAKAEQEAEQARLKADQDVAMERMIAEEEAKKEADATSSKIEQVEPVADAPKQWIKFQAHMTIEQAKGLGKYMKSAGIEYKAL